MRYPAGSALRRELLKKWLMGLQACEFSNINMTLYERKSAVKVSADIAMASTTAATFRHWRRALISDAAQNVNKAILRRVLRHDVWRPKPKTDGLMKKKRVVRPVRAPPSRRAAAHNKSSIWRRCVRTAVLAKNTCKNKRKLSKQEMVKKLAVKEKIQVLRSLIPGGDGIADECCLMDETIDYLVSLRAQVDVMKGLADAAELLMSSN